MRIKTVLTLLSPFVAYGCTLGYLWYQVRDSAEQIIEAAVPFAAISYDAIHVSLLGDEVGLDGISIKPSMVPEQFQIEEIRLGVPHVGYFLSAKRNVESKEFPEKLAIEINRAHINLESAIFDLADQAQKVAAESRDDNMNTFLRSLDALGCGEGEAFTLKDYRSMGMGNITASATMSMENDKALRHGRFNLAASIDGFYNVDVHFELDTKPGAMQAISVGNMPKSTINYSDTGLYKLRNAYCSKLNGGTVEEYVDRHISSLSAKLGATIPDESLTVYRNYMLKGGRVSLHFDPSEELDTTTLSYYKPDDIISMLGLNISINDTPVALEAFTWNSNNKLAGKKGTAQQVSTVTDGRHVAPPVFAPITTPPPVSEKATYKEVQVADAAKHINRMAEVTTAEGKVRRGILSEVNNDHLYLEMKHSAGSLTYPVEFKKVDRLRVRY